MLDYPQDLYILLGPSAELTRLPNRKVVAQTNPRGIPYAPFVDRVEDYVTTRADVERTLKNFQEMISYVCAS